MNVLDLIGIGVAALLSMWLMLRSMEQNRKALAEEMHAEAERNRAHVVEVLRLVKARTLAEVDEPKPCTTWSMDEADAEAARRKQMETS